jgi:hypothetical protein
MKTWLKRSLIVLALLAPGAVYAGTQLAASSDCCPTPCPFPCPGCP